MADRSAEVNIRGGNKGWGGIKGGGVGQGEEGRRGSGIQKYSSKALESKHSRNPAAPDELNSH